MRRMTGFIGLCAWTVVSLAGSGAAPAQQPSALELVKILPFAGADNVRVETTLKSNATEELSGVELAGRIAPWPSGPILWEGPLGSVSLKPGQQTTVAQQVSGLRPNLWSPSSPNLYTLAVTVKRKDAEISSQSVRFGFRSFETRNGQFLLNGRLIYLRGNSINPPGRGAPDAVGKTREFAEAYIRDLKSRHVNIIRVDNDLWHDVCDEMGMMVFAGRYGRPRGGTKDKPPSDFAAAVAAYKTEYFERWQRHPSLVILILSNEAPAKGSVGEAYFAFFDRVHETLRQWDPNRLYLGNAGFGKGRGGELYDQHPYWGWYGGSFLSNYSRLRDASSAKNGPQPWTFSECVGAYTTPEGRFRVEGKQLGAALAWTGHRPDQDSAALRYQAFLAKQFIEIQRRLRPINPYLAGVMAFTPIWFHWAGISRFEDMGPKPVADQLRISFQPVLLSWETWTPQAYAGATVRPIAHVVNDADNGADLRGAKLAWELIDTNQQALANGEAPLPDVPYYQARSLPVSLTLPPALPVGDYALTGRIVKDGAALSSNSAPIFIAPQQWSRPDPAPPRPVALYDPSAKTAAALKRLGIPFAPAGASLDLSDPAIPFIVGEGAWDPEIAKHEKAIQDFVRRGGRVLVLCPSPEAFDANWLGANVSLASRDGMWINIERPQHPVFSGLAPDRMQYWSDFTNWDESKPDLPRICPAVINFALKNAEDLQRAAILANFGTGLRHVALCEIFDGAGSVILSGFQLAPRSGLDPVADRLLGNLVAYAASPQGHETHPFIDSPIVWGDYPTERGVVASPLQGFLEYQDPSDKPRGRRPFGSFSYGGATGTYVIDPHPDSETGSGIFHAMIPRARSSVVTTVENPAKDDARLDVQLNGGAAGPASAIPAGKTIAIRTPIPKGGAVETGPAAFVPISVRYSGPKGLIILRTAFE